MKNLSKLGLGAAVLAVFLAAGIKPAAAQNTQDFAISDFTADYYLDRTAANTATLRTVESITAQFPNFDQNHGILRAIPESYQGHTISLSLYSLTDANGKDLKYSSSEENGNLVLKIGDAGTYIHGTQTYKITYDAKNVANMLSDQDEFYWDVNGDQWQQPFSLVTARIHLSSALAAQLQDKRICYAGSYGDTSRGGCVISPPTEDKGGKLISATVSNLRPGQTLSFVVAFKSGTFVPGPEIVQEKRNRQLKVAATVFLAVVPPFIAAIMMYRRWRRFGDDPKGRGVIIPQYEPPKGLDPLTSQFILSEGFEDKAFSALIIELAVKGAIVIHEIPKKGLFGSTDYELELAGLPVGISSITKAGLKIIFGDSLAVNTRILVSDLNKSSLRTKNAQEFKKLADKLSAKLTELGYFVKNPKKIRQSYMLWASVPFSAAFVATWIAADTNLNVLFGLALGLFLAAAVMNLFAFIMPARSLAGVEARDELRGLKDFIKFAEADRIKFLQSPQGAQKITEPSLKPGEPKFKIKLFESLLPYAIIFGQEKQWAKQFQDIYKQPPDWYTGNWTTFNALSLANSIGGFTSASSVSFSAPSSSGGSGFGGGGGAGGGGGGGGGGGW